MQAMTTTPGTRRRRRKPWRRALAALLAAIILSLPLTLSAEGLRAQADEAFREGYALYSKKDYEGALDRFLKANKLYPSYKIDLTIGYTLDALGRRAEAAGYFELFLGGAGSAANPEIVRKVRRRLRELSRDLARVTVDCPVRGAEVSVDGRDAGRTPLAHALYLAPGEHRLKVAGEGQVLFDRAITMARGGHTILTIPRPVVNRPPAPVVVLTSRAPAPRARPYYKRWWFWTAVGTVVLGAVVGGVVASQTGGSGWLPSGDSGSIRLY